MKKDGEMEIKMQNINIMIADDHKMVREGIRQLLELDGEIKVVAEADDGIECMEILEKSEQEPDVLLLDINMPNKNGLDVLKELKEQGSTQKVLILTLHNEIEFLLKAMEIGVDGYVMKDSDSGVLKQAIFRVCCGERYIQPSLTPYLNLKLDKSKEKKLDDLTRREMEVLKLVAKGMFNKEIADKLSISEKTVKNHVSSIFKKINVSDRTQAAVYAIKNNYVDL
jgi:DNA-binding NarL/FixJ family response regulator